MLCNLQYSPPVSNLDMSHNFSRGFPQAAWKGASLLNGAVSFSRITFPCRVCHFVFGKCVDSFCLKGKIDRHINALRIRAKVHFYVLELCYKSDTRARSQNILV
jgi:hypothetical protein